MKNRNWQGIPLDRAMAEFREAGFKVNRSDKTLGNIADSKGTSGMGVYAVIKKLEPKPKTMKPGSVWTPEVVVEAFAGTGVGRRPLYPVQLFFKDKNPFLLFFDYTGRFSGQRQCRKPTP